jgi:hypothetical protein
MEKVFESYKNEIPHWILEEDKSLYPEDNLIDAYLPGKRNQKTLQQKILTKKYTINLNSGTKPHLKLLKTKI